MTERKPDFQNHDLQKDLFMETTLPQGNESILLPEIISEENQGLVKSTLRGEQKRNAQITELQEMAKRVARNRNR